MANSKGFEFTMWPDRPIEVQQYDPKGLCDFPLIYTYELGIAYYYNRRPLPPGYAYFMHLGPKTKAGDWTDLALRNPIALFVLGLGFVTPIVGITYSILLYYGYCGTPNSSERPFQRKWRILLNILMVISIITSMPGLCSAYVGIMSLMSVSLQVEELPSLDTMIENSIEQITHVFTINKEEMITQTKAIIEAIIKNNINAMKKSDSDEHDAFMPTVRKPLEILKKHLDDKMVVDDDVHAGLHLVRDVYRDWIRVYADHYVFTSEKATFFSKIEFGDFPSRFLCPRMFYDYEEAIKEIEKLSLQLQERIDYIDGAYNASMNEAYKIIEDFGENAIAAANDYYNELSKFGDDIIEALNDIIKKSHNMPKYDASEISIPQNVINMGVIVCLIFSILYISFILGIIVGLLGSRGPRDIFGFNKKTSSKILTAVIISSFGAYTLCALGSIRMYYYALVMQSGICNMEAMPDDDSGGGGITIFHSCKLSDTVFTRMREWDIIPDYPFRSNVLERAKTTMRAKWRNTSSEYFQMKNLEKSIFALAMACDRAWPAPTWEEFKNDHTTYLDMMRTKYPRQYLIPPSAPGIEEPLFYMHYNMRTCVTSFPTTFTKEVIPKYLQPFLTDWSIVFANFSKDYPSGITESLRQQFKLDRDAINKYLQCPYLDLIAESVDEDLTRILHKYELWIRHALNDEIGKCGVLAEVIMRKVREACDCMLAPLDGSWTGLFWVYFTLPITIASAMALVNNYKKGSVDYTPAQYAWGWYRGD